MRKSNGNGQRVRKSNGKRREICKVKEKEKEANQQSSMEIVSRMTH